MNMSRESTSFKKSSGDCLKLAKQWYGISINQSINQFISRHNTEARATVRLCRIKEKCLETDLKCVNGWVK